MKVVSAFVGAALPAESLTSTLMVYVVPLDKLAMSDEA